MRGSLFGENAIARWLTLRVLTVLVWVLPVLGLAVEAGAQTSAPALPSFYVSAGLSGFIPVAQPYRINYSTRTLSLPIELHGALSFPITEDIYFPLSIRAIRRGANFLENTSIVSVALDPGVRYYLEKQRPKDLRFFIAGGPAVVRSEVMSEIEPSTSGEANALQAVTARYYNFGAFAELGLTYPISAFGSLDGIVHIAAYLADPVARGGLGNVGGISIGAEYRHAF